MDISDLLETKVKKEDDTSGFRVELSKEEFSALQDEVNILKQRLEKGEQITVGEAAKITVWFRARRKEAFTVNQIAAATKAKSARTSKAKKAPAARKKKPSRQELSQALIDKL